MFPSRGEHHAKGGTPADPDGRSAPRQPYSNGVNPAWTVALAGLIGLLVGAFAVVAFRVSERAGLGLGEPPEPDVPTGVTEVLAVLRL